VIDFRYHLVSIVAIFLALALGIVLGSTTLSNSVSDTLRQQANSAAKTAQQARMDQRRIERQLRGEEQFAAGLAPQLVADRLKGQSLVLIETPGASNDSIEQLSELAKNAGAAVSRATASSSRLTRAPTRRRARYSPAPSSPRTPRKPVGRTPPAVPS